MKIMRKIIVCGMVCFLLVWASGCGGMNEADNQSSFDTSTEEVESRLNLPGGIEVRLVDADIRRSYQVYYLMNYPPEAHVFLRTQLGIDGVDEPLVWLKNQVQLAQGDQLLSPEVVRPFTVGPGYQYQSSAPIELDYEVLFAVPESWLPLQASLVFAEGVILDLPPLNVTAGSLPPVATAEPEATTLSGLRNRASGEGALVVGGRENQAGATFTTIGGGRLNQTGAAYGTVAGGRENEVDGFYASIGGGYANHVSGRESTIPGGSRNSIEGRYGAIGGGIRNQVAASSASVGGGAYNQAGGLYSTIGGGTRNAAQADAAVVAGGAGNQALGAQAAVLGGLNNEASGRYAVALAGYNNQSEGDYAATLGGEGNRAGASYSLALGRMALVEQGHTGAMVLADSNPTTFRSMQANELAVRATGGVRLVSAIDGSGKTAAGVMLEAGSGSWSILSDASLKRDWQPLDSDEVLRQLDGLELGSWRYQAEAAGVRHIGPSAQDFRRAFQLGSGSNTISEVDAIGVSLAAIQSLSAQQGDLLARVDKLEDQSQALEGGPWAPFARSGEAGNWGPAGFALFGLLSGAAGGLVGLLAGARLERRRARPAEAGLNGVTSH